MDLIALLVVLIVVGLVIYLIQGYLPMDARIKQIIIAIIIIIVIIWLLQSIGLIPHMLTVK